MFKLMSFAFVLSMLAGTAALACCGDPVCCASGCCHSCQH